MERIPIQVVQLRDLIGNRRRAYFKIDYDIRLTVSRVCIQTSLSKVSTFKGG